jgi:lipoprotein-releasing system ATP-binding protein
LLVISDIYKSFGELQVLRGIDLNVKQGEIVTIVGKSGAGKSTLLHIAGTLDRPDSGSVKINGTDTSVLSRNQLATYRNQHIGFVFQFHYLLPEFTALENVMMPGLIAGGSNKKLSGKALELLGYMALEERAKHKPTELSGGEQQRVAMARALMNDPKIIFADEPTGNLDSKTSENLHRLIEKLSKDLKQTFVIVTHNKELAQLSDRTLEIVDGKIVNRQ